MRFSSLGDLVLSTVLLDAIAEAHPQAHVTWVTKRAFGELLREDSRVDRLLLLPPDRSVRWLASELKGEHFDLVLDAHGSLRSRALCAMLAPPVLRRIGKDTLDRWLHLQWKVQRPSLARRQIDRFLDLLPELRGEFRPRLQIARPTRQAGPRIAVAPGARHFPKAWSAERFAEAISRWNREHGGSVLLVGSETELIAEVQRLAEGGGVVGIENAAGTRDLRGLAEDLASCDLLLCNDSGLLHLAEAVSTPVIALFGPTTRAWGYFPLDARSQVVEKKLECRPCSRNGSRDCGLQHQLCMELISVNDVLHAMEETWKPLRSTVPR
jgi:lipopolysaccharide heptosyltransferase II